MLLATVTHPEVLLLKSNVTIYGMIGNGYQLKIKLMKSDDKRQKP